MTAQPSGHYAHAPATLATNPPADAAVERIGDLMGYELSAGLSASHPAARPARPMLS